MVITRRWTNFFQKKLTYAEKGQLEKLEEITKELLLQQDIEERRVERASKVVAEKSVDTYEKQYGKYDISKYDLDKKVETVKQSGIFPTSEIQRYIDITEDFSSILDTNISDLEEYKKAVKQQVSGTEPLSSSQIETIRAYKEIEKTKNELVLMAKVGTLTPKTIESYKKLNYALKAQIEALERYKQKWTEVIRLSGNP